MDCQKQSNGNASWGVLYIVLIGFGRLCRSLLEGELYTYTNVRHSALLVSTVDVEYILRSTKTGQTLYTREGNIKVDTSVNGGSGGLRAIVGLIATAVKTAATDKVIAGRKCNAYVLTDLPAGKYSEFYEKYSKNPAGKKFVKATVK